MDVRIKSATPSMITWTVFLVFAAYMVHVSKPGVTESFLMFLFAAFSATIATEGIHEVMGHRPLGTLKEFSYLTREELDLFNERRISVFNGILHIVSAFIVSYPSYLRTFVMDDFILVPFFRMLIPMAILLAIGSYLVNYSRIFKTPEGRKTGPLRGPGAAARTTISLLISIGACYGLATLFTMI